MRHARFAGDSTIHSFPDDYDFGNLIEVVCVDKADIATLVKQWGIIRGRVLSSPDSQLTNCSDKIDTIISRVARSLT